MEHRYGNRYPSVIEVYIRSRTGRLAAKGRLVNVSISGAFIATSLSVSPLSSITVQVVSEAPLSRRCVPIEAQVIRCTQRGLGIEWKELSTASLSQLVDRGELAPAAMRPVPVQMHR
jgi:hypothetical protein